MSSEKTKPSINKLINPCKKVLTADMLKTFAGCEDIPIEEAREIVASLEMLSVLLLEFTLKKDNTYSNE